MSFTECSRFSIFPRGFPLKIFSVILIGCCVFGTIYFATVISKIPLKELSHERKKTAAPVASDYIQVLITTSRSDIVGAAATVNSIISNTERLIQFYFITSQAGSSELHSWIEGSRLRKISYIIKVFDPEKVGLNVSSVQDEEENWLQYSKLYISMLLPQIKGVLISLTPDVIVQGDIGELNNITIAENNFGSLSKECDAVSRVIKNHKSYYFQFLNLNSHYLKDKDIDGKQCVFSLDVMVLNMTLWSKENVSTQLVSWHRLNEKENIFSSPGVLPPFLIVFNNRISPLDSSWHVRHLGMSRGTRYSRSYLAKASLLQWDGHFKPWKHKSAFSSLWSRYVVLKPKEKAVSRKSLS